jgi:hypothetical protein
MITMEKKALFLLVGILVGSILYSALCFLLGLSGHQNHEVICSISSHSCIYTCIYIGVGLATLFSLSVIGVSFSINPLFVPKEFVSSLFRPPQRHS